MRGLLASGQTPLLAKLEMDVTSSFMADGGWEVAETVLLVLPAHAVPACLALPSFGPSGKSCSEEAAIGIGGMMAPAGVFGGLIPIEDDGASCFSPSRYDDPCLRVKASTVKNSTEEGNTPRGSSRLSAFTSTS